MIVTRFHNVEKLTLGIEFLSPTFLGGADQNAELRSAPFKNLLRQWWRVANGHLPAVRLREEEGKLFGAVLGDSSAQASQLRLVLEKGKRFAIDTEMPFLGTLDHPEVRRGDGNPRPLDRRLYLGYGPITNENAKTIIRKFIKPGSVVKASVYISKDSLETFRHTLSLLFHFGTLGSRSRNGFGSVALLYDNTKLSLISLADLMRTSITFDFRMEEQNKRYPSQLCSDGQKLLCWDYIPENFEKVDQAWQEIFHKFADIYMRARTMLRFQHANRLEARHLLGYPAGANHKVSDWGGNKGRMPSQLRLMVKRNDQEQIVGRILHLPHPIPKQWDNRLGNQADIWKQVHAFLDQQPTLKRCGGVR